MKLLVESNFDEVSAITEANASGGKDLYITGKYIQTEIVNKNGRKYAKSLLEGEVARYIAEKVSKNAAYGELNHPATPQINLRDASHRIVELYEQGNDYIGKSIVLNTPMGNIVKAIHEGGGIVGVSTRGTGSLKNVNGINEVQNDYRIATAADIVSDPSAPEAFVTGIMEGVDWVFDAQNGWVAQELAENIRNKFRSQKVISEEDKLRSFVMFLDRVRNVDITI